MLCFVGFRNWSSNYEEINNLQLFESDEHNFLLLLDSFNDAVPHD